MTPTLRSCVFSMLVAFTLLGAACQATDSDTAATDGATDEAVAADDSADSADNGADERAEDETATDYPAPAEDSETETAEDDPAEPADDGAEVVANGDGLDTSLFLDGALVGEPTIADCELSDGSASQCYTVTVVGVPVNHDVGPFCPTDVTDDAEAGGLWLDGENSYEIDGAFFTELAEIYGDELWDNLVNDDGSINVIDNAEDFQVAARPDITEEFYYHCVDGDIAWVGDGVQPTQTIEIPVTPTLADGPTVEFATGAHSALGVTLNGALLSGSADMTAILASYTIAAFDDCGGHINPALGYHVHGTAGCSDVGEASEGETAPFAYAIDGFTVHGPHDDADAVELDECNGHTTEEYGYHYHAAPLEDNATLTCLNGLTAAGQNAGGRPGRPRP